MDLTDPRSHYIMKRQKTQGGGAWKKMKSNRSTIPEVLVLSKGDFDEIGDIVRHITEYICGKIEDQYKKVLVEVHQGLKDL